MKAIVWIALTFVVALWPATVNESEARIFRGRRPVARFFANRRPVRRLVRAAVVVPVRVARGVVRFARPRCHRPVFARPLR